MLKVLQTIRPYLLICFINAITPERIFLHILRYGLSNLIISYFTTPFLTNKLYLQTKIISSPELTLY